MKWISSIIFFALFWSVSYSTVIEKRASVNDVCGLGYAVVTTGGSGSGITTVTSLTALISAVAGDSRKIVVISGTITGNAVVNVGSNTSLLGARGSMLVGVGLRMLNSQNVIIRNVKVSKVRAEVGDAVNIQASSFVCLDHLDLSSDRDHDIDFYGQLLSITHGSMRVTVSNSKFFSSWKAALVGDSSSNGAEDSQITVTFALNYWNNLDSAISPFRFGHGHIFNNVFENVNDGINASDGAQLLVENNVGIGMVRAVYPTNGGFAVVRGNNFGGAPVTVPTGTFTGPPYSYTLIAIGNVRAAVLAMAGQTLSF